MKESLASRVGRLVSGSMNSIIDAVENAVPETVMEQAIREIDGAIDDVRSELGNLIATKHLANKRLVEKSSKHEGLASQIEDAVANDRDDLAEAAISTQLDIEAQIPVLEQTIADSADKEKELEGFIAALQAKRREMVEELNEFRKAQQEAPPSSATAGGTVAEPTSIKVDRAVDKATSAFDRVLAKQTGLPGVGSGDRKTATQLAELEQMSRNNRIKERLAAIKGRDAGSDE